MKIDIIILAAGESKRFGNANKLFYKVAGQTLIERALLCAATVKNSLPTIIDEIIVVSCYQEVAKYTNELGFTYLDNPKNYLGISESIKLGVLNSRNTMLFMVSDEPYLKAETLVAYIKEFRKSGKSLATLITSAGDGANPCIFSRDYSSELLELIGDRGGRKVINNHQSEVFKFVVAQEEVLDIDYKEKV